MVHGASLKSIKLVEAAILRNKGNEMRVALWLNVGLSLNDSLFVLVQNIFVIFEKLSSCLCIDIRPIELKVVEVGAGDDNVWVRLRGVEDDVE